MSWSDASVNAYATVFAWKHRPHALTRSLLAIVAAIAITLRRRINVKAQDPARQVMVRREDRIRLVKMKAEVEVPAPAAPAGGDVK